MAGSGDFLTIDRRKLDLVARRGSAILVEHITMRTAVIAATMAPGSMKEKIRPIFRGSKANPLGIVMVDHPAAHFVLNGTKAHWIAPRPGGVLRFEVDGEVVFTRKPVWHKATPPNNFLMKAMLAARKL